MTSYSDSYLMDMENSILKTDWRQPIIKGVERLNNKKWMMLVREQIDAGHTKEKRDRAMAFYTVWVKNGGGDFWFID